MSSIRGVLLSRQRAAHSPTPLYRHAYRLAELKRRYFHFFCYRLLIACAQHRYPVVAHNIIVAWGGNRPEYCSHA